MESVLLVEREGPVATLIMNRPKTKNALDVGCGTIAGSDPDNARGLVANCQPQGTEVGIFGYDNVTRVGA